MIIYVIRHGETDWSKRAQLQGRTDTEINEIGHLESIRIGDILKKSDIQCIISSPLKRARQTAEIIADKIGFFSTDINIDERLIERDFGAATGKLYENVAKEIEASVVLGYEDDEKLQNRIEEFFNDLHNIPHEKILIVTHSLVMKTIMDIVNVDYNYPFPINKMIILNRDNEGTLKYVFDTSL